MQYKHCNMILYKDIDQAYQEQKDWLFLKSGTLPRAFLEHYKPVGNHIEVISGIRRCGKSTLLKQIIHSGYKRTAYFNFEDSRMHGFEVGDFTKLDEVIGKDIDAYFFDEIQNVPSWEIFIRHLHDRDKKVFLTGSNASLLSKELGTRLTGRNVRHELFPFSYKEFLSYKGCENTLESFDYYVRNGGFPEFLDAENPEILQYLLKDVVFRDIVVRYGIRNAGILMEITLFLLSNIGKEFSYNTLRKAFLIGSANTVSDYLNWLGDSYLLFYLPRFSWSLKSVASNPRKVYAVDNGLIRSNTMSFREDYGRMLENLVYIHLRRQKSDLFYFRDTHECDFVVVKNHKCNMLIQVCTELNGDNLKRETGGLLEAMRFFSLNEGYILTTDQRDELNYDQQLIHVLPTREFSIKNPLNTES